MSHQRCPQQERSQTGNTCSGAIHDKQMASNRALSVQCRVVTLEENTGEKICSGWVLGHLSGFPQGVIFKKGGWGDLLSFFQIRSLQQVAHSNCAFVASLTFFPVPEWQLHNNVCII